MMYAVPTKKGLGVEIWGTRDDLDYFHEVLSKFWNNESFAEVKGYEDKNNLISILSYEIRKASYGSRLTRNHSHYSFEDIPYVGFQISWVCIIFSIAALRYNMRLTKNEKCDIALFLNLEYWIERSSESFDPIGANKLLPFLEDAIFAGNEYLYLYMRHVNAAFFETKGGKTAFRKLADMMRVAVYASDEYKELLNYLKSEAKKYNCKIEDLELSDDNVDYEVEW